MSLLLFFLMIKSAFFDFSWWLWVRMVLAAQPTPVPGAGGNVGVIQTYFRTLFTNGIRPIGWTIALFLFGWAAVSYMFPGERHQDNAKMAFYRVLGGVILIALTESIVGIIQSASPPPGPGN